MLAESLLKNVGETPSESPGPSNKLAEESAAKRRSRGRRLTDRIVAELRPSSKQYLVSDLSVEGCGVRVARRSKTCIVWVRLRSKLKFKTIGKITPDTPYEFLREKAIKEIAALKDTRPPKELAGEATLSDVLNDYGLAHPDLKPSTIPGYRDRLECHFARQMSQPLILLTTDEILRLNDAHLKQLQEKDPINRPPRGFYNLQSSLRTLRTLVGWYAAIKRRPSPWPDRRVLKMKPPPARELPIELQYASGRRRLIEGLKAIDSRNARACRFLLYTGLRSREGMALASGNMLTDTVIEFASKTRKLRIPLSTQAAALIDKHSPTTLMRARGCRLRSPLNRIFGFRETPQGKRARVTPHDLRRLFKSVGTELGVDPTVLNLLVGHSVKGVDKHYIAKLRLSVLKAAAQRIADEIDNPTEVEGEEEILTLSLNGASPVPAGSEQSALETGAEVSLRSADDYLIADADSGIAPIVPRHAHYLPREQLYELVWTVPMWELKDRFGLSDRGLAKICQRADIPVPGRGYWTKIDAGQLVGRPRLPAPHRNLPRILRIRGTTTPPFPKSEVAQYLARCT